MAMHEADICAKGKCQEELKHRLTNRVPSVREVSFVYIFWLKISMMFCSLFVYI